MAGRPYGLDLPLLLTGIPAAVREWLRQAGVPHAPLRLHGGARLADEERGRIVLYDSRSVSSRQDAERARGEGLSRIDLYTLLRDRAGHATAEEPRLRFFNRLKDAVEGSGGLWARVGDFPFPWQNALCTGGTDYAGEFLQTLDHFVPLPPGDDGDATVILSPAAASALWAAGGGDDTESLVRSCYFAGQPLYRAAPNEEGANDSTAAALRLWRTSVGEFARWWHWRDRLAVRVRQHGDTFHIDTEAPEGDFTPVLEIWQGLHVATFPLRRGAMALPRQGLVFQEDTFRHPGGFTALAASARSEVVTGWHQPQTA